MKVFKNFYIIPCNSKDEVFPTGTFIIDQHKIVAVGPSDQITIPDNALVVDGENRSALLPGFWDIHSHSSLLKGFSENLDFIDWLPEYQREHQVLTRDHARAAYTISYLEALKGGTVGVLDMYRFMDCGAEVAGELGLRAFLAPYTSDAPQSYFDTLSMNESLIKEYHNSFEGRVQICVGLEHLFYCSKEAYLKARQLSDQYGVYIHTHTSEFPQEVEAVNRHFGQSPISVLEDYGILGERTILAHCTCLDDKEKETLAKYQVKVAHCPTSNVKLGGGTMDVLSMKDFGINLGLGTDGSISNNSLSMFELMKIASLLQKNKHMNAKAISAMEALRMATIDGAKALGMEKVSGSLEVGKDADFIQIDLWQPHLMPILVAEDHDPILWNLVFAGRASDVVNVWVRGDQVIADGKSTKVHEQDLMVHAHEQTKALLKARDKTRLQKFIG